ncbi:hypothetical protein MMC12_006145 [Toensbergia leucococca]|nr:hypothetical protein [Toensbergia leucococca]
MSGSKLDQIVKGAPSPGVSVPTVTSRSSSPAPPSNDSRSITPLLPSDPLSTLPSSPPQIYLNLLILEASFRAQYLNLRARRRQHIFFLLLLALWTIYFFYALFLRPREDGRGVGGSVYWVVEMAEKVALMGGIVTCILIWGTGQWERGVRWPRRWIGVANRGLRSMNTKIVIIKGSWWKELLGNLSFLFPYSSFFPVQGSSFHYVDALVKIHGYSASRTGRDSPTGHTYEEDLAQGGNYIKLLLLPKPFSPDFRENWEIYRTEYWEKENERRATLRQQLKRYRRQVAREEDGWFWWTGWRRWTRGNSTSQTGDLEKTHARQHAEKDTKQRHIPTRSESHSRSVSRSSTPSTLDGEERQASSRLRRGNSNGSNSEKRQRVKRAGSNGVSPLSKANPIDPRPNASSNRSPLTRGVSSISASSGNESDPSFEGSLDDGRSGTVGDHRCDGSLSRADW